MNKKIGLFGTILTVAVLAGCNQSSSPTPQATSEVNAKPVTLQFASQGSGPAVDEEFQKVVNTHLSKKYPHITINFNPEATGTTLDTLIAAGNVPDIVVTFNGNLASYREKNLVFDMSPLIKAHNIDTSRFETNYMNDVKNASNTGEIYGLPFNVNYHAMYYNKDIFDKFGVAYPKDGLTWDQTIDLAKKVTRMSDGTQFRGLDPGSTIIWMSQPLSVAAADPITDKATMNNDKWKRVFELAKQIYSIPGNGMITASPKDQFMKTKTLGILLDLNILTQLAAAQKEGLNWDVVQYPNYPEKPNTYGNASVYVMIATKSSKYQEEVTKVIDLITSEAVQLDLSKIGRLSPLKSQAVKQALGSNNESLKGKQLPSIFKSLPVSYPVASIYRSKAEAIAVTKFKEYLTGGTDVNTLLKQADEEIDKMVNSEKAK